MKNVHAGANVDNHPALVETKSPTKVYHQFDTHQGYKSKSKCAALTNLKIQNISQHFKKKDTLHHILPNLQSRVGSVSNYAFNGHEEGPEAVPIANINSPCVVETGQREDNKDKQLAE